MNAESFVVKRLEDSWVKKLHAAVLPLSIQRELTGEYLTSKVDDRSGFPSLDPSNHTFIPVLRFVREEHELRRVLFVMTDNHKSMRNSSVVSRQTDRLSHSLPEIKN